MEDVFPDDDPEYPGVRWVLAQYILMFLKDGTPMPRCQDLPAKAFGSLRKAPRVFAVTHPWLDRWHPDPDGIQVETMRAKLNKLKKQMMMDQGDVVFFDYLCLPQVNVSGVDDRTAAEKERFRAALSGDLMGRIYLTCRVIFIDEVPSEANSSTAYLDRGWCYFESAVASMNTFPRDLMWTQKSLKDEIARFRTLSAEFRVNGDITALLSAFDEDISSKIFAESSDQDLVRGFFISLARSQRLITASARGDVEGVRSALDDGADLKSRNGYGCTALHMASANGHAGVVSALLKRATRFEASMTTMDNETPIDLAKNWRECRVLLRHSLGEPVPLILVRTVEGDLPAVRELLGVGAASAEAEEAAASSSHTGPVSRAFPEVSVSTSTGQALVKSGGCKPGAEVDESLPRNPGARERAQEAVHQGNKSSATAQQKGTSSAPRAGKAKAAAAPKAPQAKAAGAPTRGASMKTAGNLIVQSGSRSSPVPVQVAERDSPPDLGGTAESKCIVPNGSNVKSKDVAPVVVKHAESIDVNEADDAGWTALHYAVSLNHVDIVELLLKSRADPTACNDEGESAAALGARLDVRAILTHLREVERPCLTEGS